MTFLAFRPSDVVFIMLTNIKMPTIRESGPTHNIKIKEMTMNEPTYHICMQDQIQLSDLPP